MAKQYEDYSPRGPHSFYDEEELCKYRFDKAVDKCGQFWHVCTPGNLSEIINITEDDFKFAVSNMALSACEAGVVLVTDAQMETHLHGLVGGSIGQCLDMMSRYTFRLSKHLETTGRDVDLSSFKCDDPILIKDLQMMRNEIVYINRNGFVDDSRYLPFSYPWGSGYLYFNPAAQREKGIAYNAMPFKLRREMSFRRVVSMPEEFMVKDGMILPCSYADYRLGESMFRDAHHYFNALVHNTEAYSEEARRLGDIKVLGREEMYPAVKDLCIKKFNEKQPAKLEYGAKLEIARIMHSDLKASNTQIRSILGLSEYQVNLLFPLVKAKR